MKIRWRSDRSWVQQCLNVDYCHGSDILAVSKNFFGDFHLVDHFFSAVGDKYLAVCQIHVDLAHAAVFFKGLFDAAAQKSHTIPITLMIAMLLSLKSAMKAS